MTGFLDHLVVVRGGGDLGSGAIWRLSRSGFSVMVLELERPLTVRRNVAFSSAVTDGRASVQGVEAVRAESVMEADAGLHAGSVVVLVSESIPSSLSPSIVIDARVAKRNIDTTINDAPLVVALGPGFTAGVDCDAVVETKRGHDLGRVTWEGSAAPNTSIPGTIHGVSSSRVLRATSNGTVTWEASIGDQVRERQVLGSVDGVPITAEIDGIVRGLISPGPVQSGLKVGDIDPRADISLVDTISDKALAIGGGVVEAVLTWLNTPTR